MRPALRPRGRPGAATRRGPRRTDPLDACSLITRSWWSRSAASRRSCSVLLSLSSTWRWQVSVLALKRRCWIWDISATLLWSRVVSSTCAGFAAGLPQMGVPAASAGVASVPECAMGRGVHSGCMDGERPGGGGCPVVGVAPTGGLGGGASAQVSDVPTVAARREAFARALARGAGAKSPPSGRGHRSKAIGGRGGLFARVSAGRSRLEPRRHIERERERESHTQVPVCLCYVL
jgi:hypothetical protein